MSPIFWKEIRDCWKAIPVAILVACIGSYVVLGNVLTLSIATPNLPDNTYLAALLLGGLYAFALAMMQTWNEQRSDVRGWLFSQPVDRRTVFWSKCLAAFAMYAAALLPVYLAVFIWVSIWYPARGPIDPRSLHQILIAFLASFAFFPAGVWMASRRANWFGSKTLPIALPL